MSRVLPASSSSLGDAHIVSPTSLATRMSQEHSEEERKELINRALDARIFKLRGVSPRSRWAKNYSRMMREPLTKEWCAHQERLKDPRFAAEWPDKVLSGWHPRKTSRSSTRRSRP
jgi:hypothetical protein